MRIQPTTPVATGAEGLNLTDGQVVRGTVLRTVPGLAELVVRGQIFQLRTELGLVPGAQVNLQVREQADQGITLSLIPEPTAPEGPATTTATSRPVVADDLQELALALRLPAGDRTLAILRELMANGRPLTSEAVRQVLLAGRAVGGEGGVPTRPLVWLVAHGLPVTPETMRLALAALPDEGPLPAPTMPGALPATRLPGQAQAADLVLARLLPDLPPAAQEPARGLRVALAQLGLAGPPTEPLAAEGLTRRLVAIGESVATPMEAKIGRLLALITPNAAREAASRAERSPGPVAPTATASTHGVSGPAAAAPPEGERLADLRLLVARALNAVRPEEAPADRPAVAANPHSSAGAGRPAAAVEALTTLASGLEFAQLANTTRPEASDGRQTVWLPLPLPPGPDGQAPSLAVARWEGQEGTGQPRRLRATLNLALQHLGELTVTLDLSGRALRCEMHSPSTSLSLIRPALTDLHDRLAGLGYAVEAVAVSAGPTTVPPLTAPTPRRLDQRA